jgi:hypothetical protein
MRKVLFAAALSISSIAMAQSSTTTQPTTTTTGTAAQPSGQTVDDPSQATGPQGVTQQGTVPNNQSGAGREYPPCSRTVTDGCIQTYERGRPQHTHAPPLTQERQGACRAPPFLSPCRLS